MRNGCFAQHTYCGTLPPTIWVTRCTHECFLTLFCSHFPTSLYLPFSHSISLILVTFPLPRFAHNLCLLFWCRAFYHYFPLGIIAAGEMNGGYASTAGGTSRWWIHNCIDVAIFTIVDVITASPQGAVLLSMTPPSIPSSVLQLHLSTSCSVAVLHPRVVSKLAIWFQKATLVGFFSLFPFLSSTSKSTLPLTFGLLLCLTASFPRVKMSASARQGEDAYLWVIGWRHVTALLLYVVMVLRMEWPPLIHSERLWFCHGCMSLPEYFCVNIVLWTLN